MLGCPRVTKDPAGLILLLTPYLPPSTDPASAVEAPPT